MHVFRFLITACWLVLLVSLSARGSLARETSKTPRTAIEQLLLTKAVEQTAADLTIPPTHMDLSLTGVADERTVHHAIHRADTRCS